MPTEATPPPEGSRWARATRGLKSLSARLVLAFMLLSGSALGVAWLATTYAVRKAVVVKITADLEATETSFQELAASALKRLQDVAEAQARDRTFKDVALTVNSDDSAAGLEEGDAELEGIQGAHEVILSADTEVFGWSKGEDERFWAFFNARKRLVFTHGDNEQMGTQADLSVLDQALRQGSLWVLWSPAQLRALPFTFVPEKSIKDSDLLLVHLHRATTARDEGNADRGVRALGVVMTGQWVSDLLWKPTADQRTSAPTVQRTGAQFAVMTKDGAVTTTLDEAAPVLRAPGFVVPEKKDTVRIGSNQDKFLVRETFFRGLDGMPIGRVFVLRDLDKELDPILSDFRERMAPLAMSVVLLALGLAVLLARRLSAPLVQLETAARGVRLGKLDVTVPVQGTDEVARLADAFNEMVAGLRQRDQIQGLFKRYLAPQVVDELIRNPEKAAPGGERRELTVLFSDLVGFTSLSEAMSPEDLVELLNGYLERATSVLGQHGATLDKFIGDAVMCFWNAPLPQEDHAARACLTALGLLAVVDGLAPELEARGIRRLDCRIGINSGPGIVGNIGSRAAQDYTVIGDTVNLASRLEGAAKVYGTRTLVSEATLKAARGAVVARELDLLRVKGRQHPVRVYELVDVAGTTPRPHVTRFAEGLTLYRARRFAEARAVFLEHPEDPPSRVFAVRCETLNTQPPPFDWDGVFTLDTK